MAVTQHITSCSDKTIKIKKFRSVKSKENIYKKGRRFDIPRFQL